MISVWLGLTRRLRDMEKSQLPLLRKKKTPKNSTPKEKESPRKELKPSLDRVQLGKESLTVDLKNLRDRSPKSPKTRKTTLTRDSPTGSHDLLAKEGSEKSRGTSLDPEWSRYTVKSDNYQNFVPEKSATNSRIVHKCTYHKPHLPPHQTGAAGQQCAGGKFISIDGGGCCSPSAIQTDLRLSSAPTVFTFDEKHLYDHDSSPIYHELDPIDGYRTSANHTYQSITEIREEVRTLGAGDDDLSAVQSHSGRSPVRSSSGSVLLSAAAAEVPNGRRPPRTPPSPLSKSTAGSPTGGVPPPHSPRCSGTSIFSKLWLQKRTATAPVSREPGVAVGNAGVASSNATSPTSRDLTLEAICVDVTKAPRTKGGYSTVYAVTSPPPITVTVFADYYQNFHRPNYHPDHQPSARRNPHNVASTPSKRSSGFSTTCCQLPSPKTKNLAVENRLPFVPDRDLSPGKDRYSVMDRWDADTGARLAGQHTFKGSAGKTLKQNRRVAPSLSLLSSGVAAGKAPPEEHGSEDDLAPKTKVKSARTCNGHSAKLNDIVKDTKQPADYSASRGCRLAKTRLSKSEENVLALSSASSSRSSARHLFRASPIDSPLSEDDVFLDSAQLNTPSSSASRTAFSSPSCGIRMAELRASGRRKSDSKTPSPEPPATTTPTTAPSPGFFLPFFQIPALCRRSLEPVGKQDAAVQTSPTRSPVGVGVGLRIGGLSSHHRYMHTIIEEDHPTDQGGVGADDRVTAERQFGREFKAPKEENQHSVDNDNEIRQVVVLRDSERCQTNSILPAVDINNSQMVKITLAGVSCPAGNDITEQTDSLSSHCSPQTTMTSSIASSVEQTTYDDDGPGDVCQSSSDGSFTAVRSESESATVETTADKVALSPMPRRSKASRLRPPRPARSFAAKMGPGDGQQGTIASAPQPRCPHPPPSVATRAAKVGEIRTLAPPLKQFHELMAKLKIDPATRKGHSVDRVEPTGTGEAQTAEKEEEGPGEVKRSPSTTELAPPTGPSVPLKTGLNNGGVRPRGSRSSDRRKTPPHPPTPPPSTPYPPPPPSHPPPPPSSSSPHPPCPPHSPSSPTLPSPPPPSHLPHPPPSPSSLPPPSPPPHLKSPLGYSPTSGSRDRIDPVGGGRVSDGSEELTDSSNPTGCCAKSYYGISEKTKRDSSSATRHSSLSSSSLTTSSSSSSSSSACSAADSESEGVTALKTPSRKDPVTCRARQGGGNTKLIPDYCSKTANRGQGSLNLALPRTALPRISVSRCRDMALKDTHLETSEASTVSTDSKCDDDDDEDEDEDNEFSAEFSSV